MRNRYFTYLLAFALFLFHQVGSSQEEQDKHICLGSELDCIQDLPGTFTNVKTRVCRIRTKIQYHNGTIDSIAGTGVLIDCGDGSKDKVLTARHIFYEDGVYGPLAVKFDFGYYHKNDVGGTCTQTNECNAIAETRTVTKASCIQTSRSYDLALVKLDKAPATVTDSPLKLAAAEPDATVDLYIPQHPGWDCMEYASGKIDHYEAGPVVYHNISAVGGTSGASLINAAGEIVGLHFGEVDNCPNLAIRLNVLKEYLPKLNEQLKEYDDDIESICMAGVPTISGYGIIILILLLIVSGIYFRRLGNRITS